MMKLTCAARGLRPSISLPGSHFFALTGALSGPVEYSHTPRKLIISLNNRITGSRTESALGASLLRPVRYWGPACLAKRRC